MPVPGVGYGPKLMLAEGAKTILRGSKLLSMGGYYLGSSGSATLDLSGVTFPELSFPGGTNPPFYFDYDIKFTLPNLNGTHFLNASYPCIFTQCNANVLTNLTYKMYETIDGTYGGTPIENPLFAFPFLFGEITNNTSIGSMAVQAGVAWPNYSFNFYLGLALFGEVSFIFLDDLAAFIFAGSIPLCDVQFPGATSGMASIFSAGDVGVHDAANPPKFTYGKYLVGAYGGTASLTLACTNSIDCTPVLPPLPDRCIARFKAVKDCTAGTPVWVRAGAVVGTRIHAPMGAWNFPEFNPLARQCVAYYWKDIGPADGEGACSEVVEGDWPALPSGECDCSCASCCQKIKFNFSGGHYITFTNTADPGQPCSYSQTASDAGSTSGTLTCPSGIWTLAVSFDSGGSTTTYTGGGKACPPLGADAWGTSGSNTLTSIECIESCAANCASCCHRIVFDYTRSGVPHYADMLHEGGGPCNHNVEDQDISADVSLVCVDGVWTLTIQYVGETTVWTCTGSCPSTNVADWTRISGTYVLTGVTCMD